MVPVTHNMLLTLIITQHLMICCHQSLSKYFQILPFANYFAASLRCASCSLSLIFDAIYKVKPRRDLTTASWSSTRRGITFLSGQSF